uniref:Uncharacterized protein n=1 Tax=Arundo donax TaxID=35708 RepID=A0A0A9DEA9_ARUDO
MAICGARPRRPQGAPTAPPRAAPGASTPTTCPTPTRCSRTTRAAPSRTTPPTSTPPGRAPTAPSTAGSTSAPWGTAASPSPRRRSRRAPPPSSPPSSPRGWEGRQRCLAPVAALTAAAAGCTRRGLIGSCGRSCRTPCLPWRRCCRISRAKLWRCCGRPCGA